MNVPAISSAWEGRVIDGRFTLLQWLGGSGGVGVFLTELPEDSAQKAAIKLIPADATDAEAQIASWMAAQTLSHPHLSRLFHAGRCQVDTVPVLYAVSEYADEVLSQILPERPLTPDEAREMLDPVIDALAYLHGKGLVHGNLKPSNILVVGDQLKLSSDNRHHAGELNHSPELSIYDAPESATGAISPAADVWSLGVTLVEALTQHPPIWMRSSDTDPAVPESIPQPFADIARECLRRDPARRSSLGDVRRQLAGQSHQSPAPQSPALAFPPVTPDPPMLPGLPPVDKPIVTKFRVAALVGTVVILLAVIAILHHPTHQTTTSMIIVKQPVEDAISPTPPQSPVPIPEKPSPKRAAVTSTTKGAVVDQVLPDVPRKAASTIDGKVTLKIRVTVNPSGQVTDATLESHETSKYFANLALQSARKWKFKPAQVDGEAVSSVWLLRFQFKRSGTEVTPVETTP